jgi:hypothetical protein
MQNVRKFELHLSRPVGSLDRKPRNIFTDEFSKVMFSDFVFCSGRLHVLVKMELFVWNVTVVFSLCTKNKRNTNLEQNLVDDKPNRLNI